MSQTSDSHSQDNAVTKISYFSLVLGVIGFLVSLYALIVHIQTVSHSSGPAICDFNATVNCTAVIGSSYGELASIPLGSYGMTFFAIIIAISLMPKFSKVTAHWMAFWELIIAAVGLVTVVALVYISYIKLQLVCPTCSVIHVIVFIYSVAKIIQFIKVKKIPKQESTEKNESFVKFLAIALCLGIPPLAAGLIAPMLIPYFSKEKVADNKATTQSSFATDPVPAPKTKELSDTEKQLMTFNKSNFVGNGEDYRRGQDNAKVIVQIFSDFGCPHCKVATEAILKAQDAVGLDKVLVVYRFFPLSNKCNPYVPSEGFYPFSCTLSEAARCVGQQGKFWEFKEWAFSGQTWDNSKRSENFSLDGLKQQVQKLGLNAESFAQCMQGGVELQKIKDDSAVANKLGIQGTPMIFVNGKEYKSNHEVSSFMQAFSSALQ